VGVARLRRCCSVASTLDPFSRLVWSDGRELSLRAFEERTGGHRLVLGESVLEVSCRAVEVAGSGGEEAEESMDGTFAGESPVDERHPAGLA